MKGIDEGDAFANSAAVGISKGSIGELEHLLDKGNVMIEWGKIVSCMSDEELAILSTGMTCKGRHFLLAGLADERLSMVAKMTKLMGNDMKYPAAAIAQRIIEKMRDG